MNGPIILQSYILLPKQLISMTHFQKQYGLKWSVLGEILNSSESATYPVISVEEVESALKLTQRNKAGVDDGLMYEHFVYGGPLLCDVLSRFFNAVVKLSYAPKDMKRGVIITLFKSGKREDA